MGVTRGMAKANLERVFFETDFRPETQKQRVALEKESLCRLILVGRVWKADALGVGMLWS